MESVGQPHSEIPKSIADYRDQHFSNSPERPAPGTEPAEWGIFVNLAANERLLNSALRIDAQLQEQQLIDLSKKSPVRIVVQTTMNEDASLNNISSSDYPKKSMPESTRLARYEIYHGQKRLLQIERSQGFAKDLASLLSSDPEAMKARHIMLLHESHGLGMDGFEADSGTITVNDFVNTIEKSLRQAGRTKFDIVDLDSCDMANAQVMENLGKITRFAVASEYDQIASTVNKKFMQPLAKDVASTLSHPLFNPQRTAYSFLNQTKEQCADWLKSPDRAHDGSLSSVCPVNALGVYDTNTSLTPALNRLGSALMRVVHNSGNSPRVAQIVNSLPYVYFKDSETNDDGKFYNRQHRDLGNFVSSLQRALALGTLRDTPDHALSKAAAAVQTQMRKLVLADFNSVNLSPSVASDMYAVGFPSEPPSGLSILLPEAGNTRSGNQPPPKDRRIDCKPKCCLNKPNGTDSYNGSWTTN